MNNRDYYDDLGGGYMFRPPGLGRPCGGGKPPLWFQIVRAAFWLGALWVLVRVF